MNDGRRLVQFYAGGGKVRRGKPKMAVTEREPMSAPMGPAPGAPVSMGSDGPALKRGGKASKGWNKEELKEGEHERGKPSKAEERREGEHKKRGGKIKMKVKMKGDRHLAMGGNPMAGRLTTGVVGRSPRAGMPVAGGGGPSLTHGGGATMRQPSIQTVPSMMGALGRVR